jgi:hypothetical protein
MVMFEGLTDKTKTCQVTKDVGTVGTNFFVCNCSIKVL